MKHYLALITAIVTLMSFTACGEEQLPRVDVDNTAVSSNWGASSDTTETDTPEETVRHISDTLLHAAATGDTDRINELFSNTLSDEDITGSAKILKDLYIKYDEAVFTQLHHNDKSYTYAIMYYDSTGTADPLWYSLSMRIAETPAGWCCYPFQENETDNLALIYEQYVPEGYLRAKEADRFTYDQGQTYWQDGADAVWLFADPSQCLDGIVTDRLRFMWENENGDLEVAVWTNNGTDQPRVLHDIQVPYSTYDSTYYLTLPLNEEIAAHSNQLLFATISAEELPEDIFIKQDTIFDVLSEQLDVNNRLESAADILEDQARDKGYHYQNDSIYIEVPSN